MPEKKSVISQLQTVGEEALGKLSKNDVARSALQSAMNVKDRATKTLTGLEGVEKRLDAIEKRLSALEGKKSSSSRSGGGKSSSGSSSTKSHAESSRAESSHAESSHAESA